MNPLRTRRSPVSGTVNSWKYGNTPGAGVHVIGGGVRWLALAEDYADQVVRAQRQVALSHRQGNLVVRLRDQIPQRAGFFGVAIRLERIDSGQPIRYQSRRPVGRASRPAQSRMIIHRAKDSSPPACAVGMSRARKS